MKAITTKYLGPTNTKGSRVTAYDGDGNKVVLGWRSEINSHENHRNACRALCEKMGWGGRLQGADLVSGGVCTGMVWSWIDRPSQLYVKPIKAFTHPD